MNDQDCNAFITYMFSFLFFIPRESRTGRRRLCKSSYISLVDGRYCINPCVNFGRSRDGLCTYHKNVSCIFNSCYHIIENNDQTFYAFIIRFIFSRVFFGHIDNRHSSWMIRPTSLYDMTIFACKSDLYVAYTDLSVYNYLECLWGEYFYLLQTGRARKLSEGSIRSGVSTFLDHLIKVGIIPPMEVSEIVM